MSDENFSLPTFIRVLPGMKTPPGHTAPEAWVNPLWIDRFVKKSDPWKTPEQIAFDLVPRESRGALHRPLGLIKIALGEDCDTPGQRTVVRENGQWMWFNPTTLLAVQSYLHTTILHFLPNDSDTWVLDLTKKEGVRVTLIDGEGQQVYETPPRKIAETLGIKLEEWPSPPVQA